MRNDVTERRFAVPPVGQVAELGVGVGLDWSGVAGVDGASQLPEVGEG